MHTETASNDHPISDGLINRAARRVTASIMAEERTRHLSTAFIPSRREVLRILDELHTLLFPGFFGPRDVSEERMHDRASVVLADVSWSLFSQISGSLRYEKNIETRSSMFDQRCAECDGRATQVVIALLDSLPEIRRLLSLDVQAAFDGDPAARHTDEAIFCYPGIRALAVHRVAHELYRQNVPLIPRIMAEHAHSVTGIDIHPGARIGPSFFIDHGTGVVIGETTIIGEHCKLYQGVTLGAKAFLKDE